MAKIQEKQDNHKNLRPSGRKEDEMRVISMETGISMHAEGSCLIKAGNTHVLCLASIDERVAPWLRGQGKGWVTAEYGMLPRSTGQRMDREAAKGKQSGRTQEIQRLIGRALRAVVDLDKMGEIQVKIDCDVIQADGGTRTAAITGAYVAMVQAFDHLMRMGRLKEMPIFDTVAAVSCGLFGGSPVLDLDYAEDSNAGADANFVFTGSGGIVEIQGTAEDKAFSEEEFLQLMRLARKGTGELFEAQKIALAKS